MNLLILRAFLLHLLQRVLDVIQVEWISIRKDNVIRWLDAFFYWTFESDTDIILFVDETHFLRNTLPVLLVKGLLALCQIQILLVANDKIQGPVPKFQLPYLVVNVREVEPKLSIYRLEALIIRLVHLARDSTNREEETALHATVMLVAHVRVPIGTNPSFKFVTNCIALLYRFLELTLSFYLLEYFLLRNVLIVSLSLLDLATVHQIARVEITRNLYSVCKLEGVPTRVYVLKLIIYRGVLINIDAIPIIVKPFPKLAIGAILIFHNLLSILRVLRKVVYLFILPQQLLETDLIDHSVRAPIALIDQLQLVLYVHISLVQVTIQLESVFKVVVQCAFRAVRRLY